MTENISIVIKNNMKHRTVVKIKHNHQTEQSAVEIIQYFGDSGAKIRLSNTLYHKLKEAVLSIFENAS